MRNKLIILSFAISLSFTALAQSTGDDLSQEAKISVYPNPAVEYIVVEFDSSLKNATFELNSMIGNKMTIQPEELGFGKYRISVKDFATGYYFLIVQDKAARVKEAVRFLKN
ncbi:MAG: T9SS type A sorting domain-containing protein [Cyclobacteriaceae bacterium]